jgi:hypothetical protein
MAESSDFTLNTSNFWRNADRPRRIYAKQTQFRPGRWFGQSRLRETKPICRRGIRSNSTTTPRCPVSFRQQSQLPEAGHRGGVAAPADPKGPEVQTKPIGRGSIVRNKAGLPPPAPEPPAGAVMQNKANFRTDRKGRER